MKIYNKLVRDKILEIIEADGKTHKSRILDEKEYLEHLVKKLEEELHEFKQDLSIHELADLQEVILALAGVIAGREELEKVRVQKAEERGAFEKRIFLESAD